MSFIDEMLSDTITIFPYSGFDAFGKSTFGSKQEVKARWEDTITIIVDENGKEKQSQARIFTTAAVLAKDYLYNGKTSETDPTNLPDAKQVIMVKKIGNLNSTEYLIVAYL